MKNSTRFRLLLVGALILLLVALVLVFLSSNALAASKIYGTVTDAETDDTIEEADVYIYESGNKDNGHKTQTDKEGYYEVTVNPGNYNIWISKDGYESHEGEENVGFEEQVEHNAKLEPEMETYLEGYVTDANSSDPIEGANVMLSYDKEDEKNDDKRGDKEDDKKDDKSKSPQATTDSEGYYNISCEEGDYTINITHKDYESYEEQIQIEEGANSQDANLTCTSGGDGNGGKDGGGDDDDDGIGGMTIMMFMGWLLATVLLVALVIQMKKVQKLNKGKMIPSDDINSINKHLTGNHYILETSNNNLIFKKLQDASFVNRVWMDDEQKIQIISDKDDLLQEAIPKMLFELKITLKSFEHQDI